MLSKNVVFVTVKLTESRIWMPTIVDSTVQNSTVPCVTFVKRIAIPLAPENPPI